MTRGARADYDAWQALVNPGWGWQGLLPYFKKVWTRDTSTTPLLTCSRAKASRSMCLPSLPRLSTFSPTYPCMEPAALSKSPIPDSSTISPVCHPDPACDSTLTVSSKFPSSPLRVGRAAPPRSECRCVSRGHDSASEYIGPEPVEGGQQKGILGSRIEPPKLAPSRSTDRHPRSYRD